MHAKGPIFIKNQAELWLKRMGMGGGSNSGNVGRKARRKARGAGLRDRGLLIVKGRKR